MLFIVVSVIVGMLCISAIISATETAITASSPGIIQKLKAEGSKRAELLLGVLKIKEKVISTLLIGNNLANIICTTIATSLFIDLLGDEIGTLVSSIVMSIVIIIFSEVIPKAIAVAKPENIAITITPIVIILLKILRPINILLSYFVKGFCFIFRISLHHEVSAEDEVRGVIEHHMYEGNVVKDDRDMLGGILDMRSMAVSDIMVHRSSIVAIDINTPTEQIISVVLSSPHSRIPFWEKNHDNIIGILHIKDLVSMMHDKKEEKEMNIRELLNEPYFIPDNALVINQLQVFREGHTHIACVVDEYGDLQGILTLEDILEEIVGQIYDEHDSSKNKVIKKSDTEYIIDGTMTVRDLNRELNWTIPETESNTIAGFIIDKMEKIPNQGEYLVEKNLKMTIKKKFENRIKTIQVIIEKDQDEDSGTES